MDTFGIPYAFGRIINGRLYRVCPVCGEELPEETDRHGEEETTNYAEHYEAEHQQVEELFVVEAPDGTRAYSAYPDDDETIIEEVR